MKPIELDEKISEFLYRRYGAGSEVDGKILFHPFELLYFLERKKINLDRTIESQLRDILKDKEMEQKFKVFAFLRSRGYIVKPTFSDQNWFRVFRKGFRPGEDRSQYLLKVIDKINLNSLGEDLKTAGEMRKELIYAIFNKEEINFIKVSKTVFE